MSEITSEDRRAVMERYGTDVYQIRLNVATLLYSSGVALEAAKSIEMADSFLLALIQNPPIY